MSWQDDFFDAEGFLMGSQGGCDDSIPPYSEDEEFSPYEEAWNHEFLAGWLDGFAASKRAVIMAASHELRRFGLGIDADGLIGDEPSPRPQIPRRDPDNPDGDPAYTSGWDRGYEEGRQRLLRRLRSQLCTRDLFLSDSVTVTTTEVASRLVDLCRRRTRQMRARPVFSDSAIHAFIDGEELPESEPSSSDREDAEALVFDEFFQDEESLSEFHDGIESPETETPAPRRGFGSRVVGALQMVKKQVDRRAAIVAISGVLATTAGFGWWSGFTVKSGQTRRVATVGQTQSTQPPATPWANYPAELNNLQAFYQQLDGIVTSWEAAGLHSVLRNLIANVMAGGGNGELKTQLAGYFADREREDYLDVLMLGLNPNVTTAPFRQMLVGTVLTVIANKGPHAVPQPVIDYLNAYQQSQLETDVEIDSQIQTILTLHAAAGPLPGTDG